MAASQVVPATIDGPGFDGAFNAAYLSSALGAFTGNVRIAVKVTRQETAADENGERHEYVTVTKPAVLTADGDTFTAVIMPIRSRPSPLISGACPPCPMGGHVPRIPGQALTDSTKPCCNTCMTNERTARMTTSPVERGGIVRVLCDTTDNMRVIADVTAESVHLLKCGCWRMRTTRPGPDIEGPYSYRGMEVIFQVCGGFHDDGSQVDGTKVPAPIVIRRTA